MTLKHVWCLVLSGALSLNVYAQSPYPATLLTEAPVLDGILNEKCWKEIQPFSHFESFIPDFGRVIPQKTEAWIAYDPENLYFAFRCHDDEPEKIKATLTPRDQIRNDDWVCINLDTHNDQQAITAIYVNPLGIQMDTRFAAGKEDPSIDLVWYSAGLPDSAGYSIEIRIPLKSLRFSDRDPVVMGLFLERYLSRTSTHVSCPALDPAQGYAFFNQTLEVSFEGVKHYTLLEVLPALTYHHRDVRADDQMVKDIRKPDLSLTLKYGITSNMVLDATLNPDFSQVESDAGQVDVNLRFANFYSEKRPFFLEGQEKFNIGATGLSETDPLISLVHTRTIANPITGMKLTGKIGPHNDLALIYAMDELNSTGDFESRFAHFPVLRYKRALWKESYLGFLYTGREGRDLNNRVYGADGQLRINPSTMMEFSGFNSHTTVNDENLTGLSLGGALSHDSRNHGYSLSLREIGKDFQVNTGYVSRTGITQFTALYSPKFYPPSEWLRKITLELFSSVTRDQFYDMWESSSHLSALLTLGGTTRFKARYELSNEIFAGERFNTGGIQLTFVSLYRNWLSVSVLYRNSGAIYYAENPYQGRLSRLTGQLDLQPWPKFNANFRVVYYGFSRTSDGSTVYQYPISRLKLTYQFNKFLFLRAITEYNGYYNKLLNDLLVSFTYIPGTVFYLGYGSLYRQEEADLPFLTRETPPHEMQRGFFIKLSYLYRH